MIWCCNGCKRPWKNAYCHGSCPDYLAQKAAHEAEREQKNRENYTRQQLSRQQENRVLRTKKRNRRTWNTIKEQ